MGTLGQCPSPLLPRQLLIELGHIIIPFGLVTRAGHWGPKLILFAERGHLEFATVVSRSVAENGLVTLQWSFLLVNQQDVAVQACALGRPRAHIIGENRATADVVALHVDHQEMVPFPTWRKRGPSASQEVRTKSQAKSANRTLIRDTKV